MHILHSIITVEMGELFRVNYRPRRFGPPGPAPRPALAFPAPQWAGSVQMSIPAAVGACGTKVPARHTKKTPAGGYDARRRPGADIRRGVLPCFEGSEQKQACVSVKYQRIDEDRRRRGIRADLSSRRLPAVNPSDIRTTEDERPWRWQRGGQRIILLYAL